MPKRDNSATTQTTLRRAGSGTNRLRIDGPRARRHRARLIGDGDTLLVFSHGLGTDQTCWRHIADALPADASALFFDLPGAGPLLPADFSPDDYRTIAAYADDLLALLDEIGVTRCIYVGHSVSGMIGVLAALEDPARFEKLVLLNASPRYLDDDGYAGGFTAADLAGLLEAMSANYQAWVAGFAPLAVAADVPGAIEDFAAGFLAMRPDVTVRIARTIFETDVRHLLPKLAVPTILIHSREDIAVPETVARYLHRHIAGSELHWIEARGHLPHLSAPDAVLPALLPHLG